MTGMSKMKEPLSCREASRLMEKTVLEEPLSDDERKTVRAHVDECVRCRNIYRISNALPIFAEATTEGEYDEDIRAVLDVLKTERKQERKRRAKWSAFGVAAALAAVILLGVWQVWESNRNPTPIMTAEHCAPAVPVEAAPGVRLTFCQGVEPGTLVQDGAVRVSLHEGSVALSVDPERPGKYPVSVVTPSGEVRVKGTLFSVHVTASDERVEVYRGVVEIISSVSDVPAVALKTGFGAKIGGDNTYALKKPLGEALIGALAEEVSGAKIAQTDDVEQSVETVSASADAVTDEMTEAPSDENSKDGNTTDARKRTAKSLDDLIAEARDCLLTHDWTCAASRYKKVLRLYSRHRESTAVLISLAKIELRHLNAPGDALYHYNAYLQKAPTGPLAEEALFGTAKSYQRLGRIANEKQALQRFAQKYPGSSLMGKVQARLNQLSQSSNM